MCTRLGGTNLVMPLQSTVQYHLLYQSSVQLTSWRALMKQQCNAVTVRRSFAFCACQKECTIGVHTLRILPALWSHSWEFNNIQSLQSSNYPSKSRPWRDTDARCMMPSNKSEPSPIGWPNHVPGMRQAVIVIAMYYNNSCYNNKTEDQRTASVHCLVIPVQDMWPGRHYDSHCQGVLGRCLIATGQYLEIEAANVALTMCKEIDDRLHGRSSHSCLLRLYMSWLGGSCRSCMDGAIPHIHHSHQVLLGCCPLLSWSTGPAKSEVPLVYQWL